MQKRLGDIHQWTSIKTKALVLYQNMRALRSILRGFSCKKGVKLLGQTITFSLLNYEFSIPMPFSERGKTQKTKQLVQVHIELRFEQNMFESKTVVSRYLLP